MKYDFDRIIDRSGSYSLKYDGIQTIGRKEDLLPLWVADMDFATPPFIVDALKRRLENPVLGYTYAYPGYYQAVINWINNHYDLNVQKRYLHYVTGVVNGINFALALFTEKRDKILILSPVYHPFRNSIIGKDREAVISPLRYRNGTFEIDFEDFRHKTKECKAFILCNPHNPGGIVWKKEVLCKIAEICAENNCLVISDEIHADLTFNPLHHHPFASVSEDARQNSITFMSPTKAFNMPGITGAHVLVFNEDLRESYFNYLTSCDLDVGNIFSYIAVQAAYEEGEEWLKQVKEYIHGNIDYVLDYLENHIPEIRAIRPQASYLIYLDCRGLGFHSDEELEQFFVDKARLALNTGVTFGQEGWGFMRLNAGCPRSVLEEAMKRLENACHSL